MVSYLRRLFLANITSPQVIALLNYLIFIIAWLFPPEIYVRLIVEPDYVFLDPATLLYYSAAISAFLLGMIVHAKLRINNSLEVQKEFLVGSPLVFLLLPLGVSTFGSLGLLVFLGEKLDFLKLLLTLQGSVLKEADHDIGISYYLFSCHIAIVLWAYRRSSQLQLEHVSRRIFSVFLSFAVVVAITLSLAIVDRGSLIALSIGLFVVRIQNRTASGLLTVSRVLQTGLVAGIVVVALFISFALLRGFATTDAISANLLGYSLVSYNRLAAILHGRMSFPFQGRLIYLFPAAMFNPPFHGMLGIPTRLDVFKSEFTGVMASGLNYIYIWAGAFGYIFADSSWFSLLYIFMLGVLYSVAWHSFRSNRSAGIIMYPYFAACQMLWITWNALLDTRFLVLCTLAALITIYERRFMISRRIPANTKEKARVPNQHRTFRR